MERLEEESDVNVVCSGCGGGCGSCGGGGCGGKHLKQSPAPHLTLLRLRGLRRLERVIDPYQVWSAFYTIVIITTNFTSELPSLPYITTLGNIILTIIVPVSHLEFLFFISKYKPFLYRCR